MVEVPDQTQATLHGLMLQWIRPGTHLYLMDGGHTSTTASINLVDPSMTMRSLSMNILWIQNDVHEHMQNLWISKAKAETVV